MNKREKKVHYHEMDRYVEIERRFFKGKNDEHQMRKS